MGHLLVPRKQFVRRFTTAPKFEHNLHAARKVAKDMKGDVMFVSVTTDEAEHKRVIEFFGIGEEEVEKSFFIIHQITVCRCRPSG